MHLSKGVIYMFLAGFFFSTMNLCVKFISHIPAVEVVFFRSVFTLVFSLAYLLPQGIPFWGKPANRKWLLLRGLSGATALVCYFQTLQAIPLASAVTMQFLAPIFTAIFGVFIVNEKVGRWQWLFFLISFGGVLLVEGFDHRISWGYVLLGLAASCFSGLAHNFIRKIRMGEHPLVIIFYFPLVTVPVTAIWVINVWESLMGWDWLWLLIVGILTQIAQVFMTKAYQHEEISNVTSIRYFSIVYALIFGYSFFGETYDGIAYAGMAMSVSGVFLNLYYKKRLLKAHK